MNLLLQRYWSLSTILNTATGSGSGEMPENLKRRAARVIDEAHRFVPIYRNHWRAAGIDIELNTHCYLQSLPTISKADFLAGDKALHLDQRYSNTHLSHEKTSGSSGEPFTIYMRRSTALRRRIRFLYALLAAGYRPGQRFLIISTRRSSSISMHMLRWRYVNLCIRDHDLAQEYRRFKPQVLYGPLSALLSLARELTASDKTKHTPEVVISTAEQLTESHRRELREAFCTDITDFYGCSELGLLAWRRPQDAHYSWWSQDFVLEFLPSPHHGLERLVVTDLSSSVIPCIRFETGDLVRRDHASSGAPIAQFSGRDIDSLVLPDGARLSPYVITMSLETIAGIDRYQVVQRTDLGIDVFIWSRTSDADAVVERAREAIEEQCGYTVPVTGHLATASVLAPDAKLRPVQSLALRAHGQRTTLAPQDLTRPPFDEADVRNRRNGAYNRAQHKNHQ